MLNERWVEGGPVAFHATKDRQLRYAPHLGIHVLLVQNKLGEIHSSPAPALVPSLPRPLLALTLVLASLPLLPRKTINVEALLL